MVITSGATGLTVAQALALPYLVVESMDVNGNYQINASPPYYSSFLFRNLATSGHAFLPPVNLIPGLFLVARVWNASMKFFQYEDSQVYGYLVHIGGSVGNTDHINASLWNGSFTEGSSFAIVSTGSAWMLLNSFLAASYAS